MMTLDYITLLEQGVSVWNDWKSTHTNSKIDLSWADLRDFNLIQADLRNVNLSNANLCGAGLTRAKLSGTNLKDAKLRQAVLKEADLRNADLNNCDLSGAVLTGAKLINTDLSNAKLVGAFLAEADLRSAFLSHADLSRALLINSSLVGADLRGAVFMNADLSGAVINGARLDRANFKDATLTNALLEFSDLNKTYYDLASLDSINLIVKGFERSTNYNKFSRFIEFAPEHKQAGIAILSYFSTVVQQKYPDMEIKVTIEQETNIVRMIVETNNGHKEIIERTLEEYGLCIKGVIAPEEFLSNPFDVMALKYKLELATSELRVAKEIQTLMKSTYENRISSLEQEVGRLHNVIFLSLSNSKNSIDALIEKYNSNELILSTLKLIENKLNIGIDKESAEKILFSLKNTKNQNKGFLNDLKTFVMNSMSSSCGDLISTYAKQLPVLLMIIQKALQ